MGPSQAISTSTAPQPRIFRTAEEDINPRLRCLFCWIYRSKTQYIHVIYLRNTDLVGVISSSRKSWRTLTNFKWVRF